MSLKELLAKSFLFNLFALARFSHAKKYLIKNLFNNMDPYKAYVLAKDKERSLSIWALKQIKNRKEHVAEDLYIWKLGDEKWLGNLDHVHGLYEYLQGAFEQIYLCECKNKIVLDIGGYIGDTARFFLKKGASKVIIYEPVKKNVECLQMNLQKYKGAVEIIPKGIAAQSGEMTILSNYPAGHIGFGNKEGKYRLVAGAESFHSILTHVKADIAKVDCEGNEKYLIDVESEALRHIGYWMIEVHDPELIAPLDAKFHHAGFKKRAISTLKGHAPIFHYHSD